MKRMLFALVLAGALAAVSACSTTGTLHTPTTAGNAGTSALVAYSVAGFTAGQYLALPVCAVPAVYPCKTKALNDQIVAADTVAYNAAKAADAAGDPASAATAASALATLQSETSASAVKSQIDLVKAAGAKP